jgi:hypothetical protein
VISVRLPEFQPSAEGGRRLFLWVLAVTFALRIVLAARLPITGDEAYFYFWGRYPDWGFYDHPPMVGWWLAVLAKLSDHPLVLRAPALLAPPIVAVLVQRMLAQVDAPMAWLAATLVLLAPLNAWNVAVTTDVPLMVFAAATMAAYLRALRTGRATDYLLCGAMLAGALLSKYFAGMLALGLAGHAITRARRTGWAGLALIVAGALPAALVQAAWNDQNCWPNLMFNLVNRHGNAGWAWHHTPLYLLSVAYVLLPGVAWGLLRDRSPIGEPVQAEAQRALAWMAGLPFALFLLLSLVKTIGLHWLASFVAPAIALYAWCALPARRTGALRFGIVFAALHWLLIGGLSLVPLEAYRHWKSYPGIVMTLSPASVADALAPYRGRFVLAADGYSPAVTMGFNLREYVLVFGPGSSHARHDDILTDFRRLAGRDLLIVRKDGDRGFDDAPYFERVVRRTVDVRGAAYELTEGYGFRYERYRDTVLEGIRRDWYQVPAWLPGGPCYFCDRYFADRACHR